MGGFGQGNDVYQFYRGGGRQKKRDLGPKVTRDRSIARDRYPQLEILGRNKAKDISLAKDSYP
jgi:hypothetical protein